jgi:hypothetical protein
METVTSVHTTQLEGMEWLTLYQERRTRLAGWRPDKSSEERRARNLDAGCPDQPGNEERHPSQALVSIWRVKILKKSGRHDSVKPGIASYAASNTRGCGKRAVIVVCLVARHGSGQRFEIVGHVLLAWTVYNCGRICGIVVAQTTRLVTGRSYLSRSRYRPCYHTSRHRSIGCELSQ